MTLVVPPKYTYRIYEMHVWQQDSPPHEISIRDAQDGWHPYQSKTQESLVAPPGFARKILYCLVRQSSQDKKGWNGFPDGSFIYPKDRTSLSECEALKVKYEQLDNQANS